jgi:SAM-dependent methyltransferase
MLSTIGKQFRQPKGFLGKIVSVLMEKGNSREYDQIIRELSVKAHDKLFEIGYGHGLGIDRICTNYDCHVSGIDFSELMFRIATKRNKKHIANKKVDLHYGDFLNYEIIPNEYDKVYCLNVVYFWDNPEIPFSKIRSGLKAGGTFCFFMAHRDDLNKIGFTKDGIFNKFTIEEIVEKLKLAGFANVVYKSDHGYIIKCGK